MEKVCFKCKELKPLSDYYKHKMMGDGHLNKCKLCAKKDVKDRYDVLKSDSSFIQSERKRGRNKYRRLYLGTGKANAESNKRYIQKYPEKAKCQSLSSSLKNTGFEKHHWSYNIEHAKDVIWLTKKDHNKAHRFIVYDQERMMYRRFHDNILLDTKELHHAFIDHCIKTMED